MQRSVGAHVEDLERILQQLNEALMSENDLRVRNSLEARARAAESALQHFQTALEIEKEVHGAT